MEAVINLVQSDIQWANVIIGVCLIFLAVIGMIKVKDYFFERFGIETKRSLAEKKRESELNEIKTRMNEYESKRESDIAKQEKAFIKFSETLVAINEKLDKQSARDFTRLKHTITRAGEEALGDGKISIRAWRSIHDLYDEYVNEYSGNGYVKTLMRKVDELPIVGQLDEHENDIE